MTAAHEPTIHYLDSVLSEEEKRCDYDHQWRNISISRSGRFRSKCKRRDTVDGKLFDAGSGSARDNEKVRYRGHFNKPYCQWFDFCAPHIAVRRTDIQSLLPP
ncbi:uncharacterized protein LOC108024982 isoform X2 [Drosophila biarmipes]|uniref:uncharacterized protein LOC108024982 isoform X2 n=1 Tax=Drosophila biarmipes TaxID=125945 RepID=UPI0007E5C1FB|nr:uncharacterized protein LOC108024982 isoform X2 [Drosophila biarmipes]